jgi:hypothetical protein
MPILPSIITRLNSKRMQQIDLFRNHPFEIQQDILKKLLDRAKGTEWGQTHDFTSIENVTVFQERLPIQTYDDLKPLIQRLRDGEKNIFWPGEIKWFAKSSGTTSDKSKFIPVTREALEDCHFRGGKDVLILYAANFPETKIFQGKGLTLGGTTQINNFSNESFYGDLSAILIENTPVWVDLIRTPSRKIALLDEWEEKLDKITKATVKENVTNIAGVPSWNLVLLKHILNFTGKKHLLEIWPNLELFTHGGVSFVPYREQFRKIIPSDRMNYMEVYNASEGFFSIQDDPTSDDMLLMLDLGIFYEFIPLEEMDKDNPTVLSVADLEKDRNYAIVISTNGGLWRYVIGDTVMFTSLYPHKIKITGRTKHFINAFGEEVIIDNATMALQKACKKTGAVINEYTAGPIYMKDDQKGSHEWLIEFETPPSDIELFTNELDQALMSINSDYEAKRYKNITLDKPVVRSMKPGVFYQWFTKNKKLGGQNKVPRLANDRRYLDEVKKINDTMTFS